MVPAFFLGTWVIFFSTKGSPLHRALGSVYMALMTITAIAAIFVKSLHPGHFSWLHVGVYFGGLGDRRRLIFYPGRLMYRLFFT